MARYVETYHLTAYDHKTHEVVFDWPVVGDTHRWATGEIIEDGTKHYRVIGVLDSSTVLDWHIGVSLLEEG
jgi:hypothetical protein